MDKPKVEVGADIDMVLFGSGIMVTTALPKVPFCTWRACCVLLITRVGVECLRMLCESAWSCKSFHAARKLAGVRLLSHKSVHSHVEQPPIQDESASHCLHDSPAESN